MRQLSVLKLILQNNCSLCCEILAGSRIICVLKDHLSGHAALPIREHDTPTQLNLQICKLLILKEVSSCIKKVADGYFLIARLHNYET